MVSREDRETYRALVYTLCEKYMIAADPQTVKIKVNIDGVRCKYVEIDIAKMGFHINVYDRNHRFIQKAFMKHIVHVIGFLNQLF